MTSRPRVLSRQILEMADVTLKRRHHVISVPTILEPQGIINLQQVVVNDGVVQVFGHQHWEVIIHVLFVALPVPHPSAWFKTPSADAKF